MPADASWEDRGMPNDQHDTVAAWLLIPIRRLPTEEPEHWRLGRTHFLSDSDSNEEAGKQLRRDLATAEANEFEEPRHWEL